MSTRVINTMTPVETRIKEVYERKLRRELTMSEIDEIALWYQQFAALLLKWSRDEELRNRLGLSDRRVKAKGECLLT